MSEIGAYGQFEDTRIVINKANWEHRMQAVGLLMEKDVAAAMQMSEVTLWRVRKGRAQPGQKFINRACAVFRLDPNEPLQSVRESLFDNAI